MQDREDDNSIVFSHEVDSVWKSTKESPPYVGPNLGKCRGVSAIRASKSSNAARKTRTQSSQVTFVPDHCRLDVRLSLWTNDEAASHYP